MTFVTSRVRVAVVESKLDELMRQIETAKPLNTDIVVTTLRDLGRHVEADLIEAQRDHINLLELTQLRRNIRQAGRNRKRK